MPTTSKVGKILAEKDTTKRDELIDALSEEEAKQFLKFIITALAQTKKPPQ